MHDEDKISILLVDDRADKLVALSAILDELGENVVCASSGRDALRHLLGQDFAIILLDINMPAMDGFETAALIRQHPRFKSTPIIFMTALGDDVNLERSYSLGAVDYILTPPAPQVLKTKVQVFVDLHRKTEQVRRQADALRRRATQLHKLTGASVAITSALSLEAILRAINEAARGVVGAHQATTTVARGDRRDHAQTVISVSDKYAAYRDRRPDPTGTALYALASGRDRPSRMTERELAEHPELSAGVEPALRGWLATSLTEIDGKYLGLLQLSDKYEGDFSDDDEAILAQLAQLGSIAIQNCLHAEAREANRLKDEFLATLSHELRTPLTAMLSWTRLLRGRAPDAARVARGIEVIERGANTLARLIDDLLDISRITNGKLTIDPRPVSLDRIIENVVETQRPAAEQKQVTLTSCVNTDKGDKGNRGERSEANDGGHVLGDAERLRQVVVNLVSNAIKFTPSGGRVEVSAQRVRGMIELRVADSGVGIGPEFLPYVFDRFRQADSSSRRAHGGLGIGLAVVHHLVELHGGTVRALSGGLDKGSTFVIELPALPRTAGAAVRADDRNSLAPPSVGGTATLHGLYVLLVEDDADARETLLDVLRGEGAEVTAVASVREALAAMDLRLPDVLVSDVAMPDEDGYDLIREVRRRGAQAGGGVPAVALSAFAYDHDRARSLAAGFQMHLAKPIEPAHLTAAVSDLAQGGGRAGSGGSGSVR